MSEYIVEVPEWVIDVNGNSPFGKSEQIVRCKDCANKQPYDEPMGCDCLCGLFWIEVEPDGFCAWAEQREK